MNKLDRRAVTGILLRIPVVGLAANWLFFGGDPTAGTVPARGQMDDLARGETGAVAVRVLRLINTAQHAHRSVSGRFDTLQNIWSSVPVRTFLDSEKARKKGLGTEFLAHLRLDQAEVVPGLRLQFLVSGDGKYYVASLEDLAGGAFATDQKALIHEGKAALSFDKFGGGWDATTLLTACTPLAPSAHASVASAGAFARLLRFLAIGPAAVGEGSATVHAGVPACGDGCCTYGHCVDTWATNCSNCGCQGCIWCC